MFGFSAIKPSQEAAVPIRWVVAVVAAYWLSLSLGVCVCISKVSGTTVSVLLLVGVLGVLCAGSRT